MTVAVEAPGPEDTITEIALTELGDKLLKRRGYVIKETSTSLNARDGYPQRVYVKDGRMLFVEYLSAKGKPTKTQGEWRRHIESVERVSMGAVDMLVIRPSNWNDLRKAAL